MKVPPAMTVYTVDQFDPDKEKQDLLSFWYSCEDKMWKPERIDWFCRFNGFAGSKVWVLRQNGSPAIIGSASTIMRPFVVDGMQVMGGINCDIVVDKKHRSLGPALKLINGIVQSAESDPEFLLTFPNDAAKGVTKRCGYTELGLFYRWVKLFRTEKKLRPRIPNFFVRKVVSGVVDLALRAADTKIWLKRLFYRSPVSIQAGIKTGTFFPRRFDVPVCGERNLPFMLWRYAEIPDLSFSLYSVLRGAEVIAYIVCSFSEHGVNIEDIIPSDPSLLTDIILSFINYARDLLVDSISFGFFGNSFYERLLEKLGFYRRESRSLWIYLKNGDLKSRLLDKENWFLLHGDIDL